MNVSRSFLLCKIIICGNMYLLPAVAWGGGFLMMAEQDSDLNIADIIKSPSITKFFFFYFSIVFDQKYLVLPYVSDISIPCFLVTQEMSAIS